MPASAAKKTTPTQQDVCIDLPGETVQCWRSSDNIRVILRKHRDVILDLNLGKGQTYTVEANKSDFYNARDKKLIRAKSRDVVTFTDGERLHLWVTRSFEGMLTVKCGGEILIRITPNEFDTHRYDNDPKTKPAPIIVTLGPSYRAPTPSPTSDQTMHVIEVRQNDPKLPSDLAAFFKQGGEQTAIDANGQITRNWLWGMIAGSAAYLDDNQQWVRELWSQKFYLQKVVHKNVGTKWYIVFKGNQQLRQYFTAARYGVTNSKVLSITSGAGSTAGLRHGAWDAAKGSMKKAGGLAVVFTIALDTAEWMNDYEQRDPKTGAPKKDFFDLVFKIGIDLVKAGLSAALGAVAMGALVFLGVVTGGAAVVVGAIILSVAIGVAIDWLDKKTGATDSVNRSLRDAIEYLEKKMPKDYGNYDNALQQAIAYGGMGA